MSFISIEVVHVNFTDHIEERTVTGGFKFRGAQHLRVETRRMFEET